MIDMLAALYSGNTKGGPGDKSKNSRQYMRDCMKYEDHFTFLLLRYFSTGVAKKRNISFNYFFRKFCTGQCILVLC